MLLLQAMARLGCGSTGRSLIAAEAWCLLVSYSTLARIPILDAVCALSDDSSHRRSSLWTDRDGRPGDTQAASTVDERA